MAQLLSIYIYSNNSHSLNSRRSPSRVLPPTIEFSGLHFEGTVPSSDPESSTTTKSINVRDFELSPSRIGKLILAFCGTRSFYSFRRTIGRWTLQLTFEKVNIEMAYLHKKNWGFVSNSNHLQRFRVSNVIINKRWRNGLIVTWINQEPMHEVIHHEQVFDEYMLSSAPKDW